MECLFCNVISLYLGTSGNTYLMKATNTSALAKINILGKYKKKMNGSTYLSVNKDSLVLRNHI